MTQIITHPLPKDPRFVDQTGRVFGQWKVVSFAGRHASGQLLWNCHCACGADAVLTGNSLKQGNSQSCGRCQSQPRSKENDDYLKILILLSCNLTQGGCWEWQYASSDLGYGVIEIHKRTIGVHTLTYMLCGDGNPEKLFVLHKCDNRICCNPDHLFLGTQEDNMLDMVAKGRNSRGEAHAKAIKDGWDRAGWDNHKHKRANT